MGLIRLGAEGFRNLRAFEIEPAPGINLITGDNGAGKTSLLETIYFLSRAKSFRTNRVDRVRTRGMDTLQVVGGIASGDQAPIAVGLRKQGRDTEVRVAGQAVNRTSELAKLLPVIAIGAESHRLLEDGPELRRRYIDWTVFHMEHPSLDAWRHYSKSLQQRNAAIRAGQSLSAVELWNHALITHCAAITDARSHVVARALPIFTRLAERLIGGDRYGIHYRPGWPGQFPDYASALGEAGRSDRARGFTQYGAHRGEVVITHGDRDVRETLSRGQQKLIVSALLLAQMLAVVADTGKEPILLYDDLPAELDKNKRAALLAELRDFPGQTFITSIESEPIVHEFPRDPAMFHVEQGEPTRRI